MRLTFEERFWAKVDKSGECWAWTGYCDRWGHGQFYRNGRHQKAHRASWEMHNGPIPQGALVCHRCDNPPCVNPAHLFLGTNADNSRDMVNKKRQAKGERMGSAKLTADEVRAIRAMAAEAGVALNQTATARQFGVSATAIRFVIERETWRHI
jgi:hypothetical protein